MIPDPLRALGEAVGSYLRAAETDDELQVSPRLSPAAPWRPPLYDTKHGRAWHLVTEVPHSDSWLRRIAGTRDLLPDLQVGVGGSESVLATPQMLDAIDQLEAAVIVATPGDDGFTVTGGFGTAAEFIYERKMKLDHALACHLLDRGLQRALEEEDPQRKGVLLELVAALMFSQVSGFEVTASGISRRSQQIDIPIHNRNIGGILSGSQVVWGEVKNWARPVGPREYSWFARKMATSNGRSKLGFFVVADEYTAGSYAEAIRDTSSDLLIVLLDRRSFPAIWREHPSITEGVERMALLALQDQAQRLTEEGG